MHSKRGTIAALSTSIGIALVCSWAIAQEQTATQPSPTRAQNQLQHQQGHATLQTPQTRQGNSVQPKKPEKLSDDRQLYMQAKLASSQKVMEGLVTENFVLIDKGAKQMKKISEAAHWPHTLDEVYQHYSVSFRSECDKLSEQAERQDLQAAHYTYLHLSTTCIECHNYVRGRFRVEREKKGGPVKLIPTYWDGKQDPPQPDVQDKHG